jgi:histidinol-phosphate phosphatase family protein
MELVVVLGYPAAGKSSWTAQHLPRHHRLNRDTEGGRLDDLLPPLSAALAAGRDVVLDNTYATRAARAPLLALAKQHGARARCVWIDASIEDAQVNAVTRMVRAHGKLPSPAEIKTLAKRDPGVYGPGALFAYRKAFEPPTAAEGFDAVERVAFRRAPYGPAHTQKALLLDYDGTLRRTRSGAKYPTHPDDIEVLPGRAAVLQRYRDAGYRLFGVSNQSGVSKGELTEEDARQCFARTNTLLGHSIEVAFCPHNPAPIACWCRKPMPGLAVDFIERHKLDPTQTLMVGDMTTDRTFATRAGIVYRDVSEVFPG